MTETELRQWLRDNPRITIAEMLWTRVDNKTVYTLDTPHGQIHALIYHDQPTDEPEVQPCDESPTWQPDDDLKARNYQRINDPRNQVQPIHKIEAARA